MPLGACFKFKSGPAVLVAILWLGCARTHAAQQYTIAMTSEDTFSPSYLVVHVGDTVTWVNQDPYDFHDSSSLGGYWYSGMLDYNQMFSITPSFTGAFPYEDTTWSALGMTGTIVVTTAAPPPLLQAPVCLPNGDFQCVVSNLVVGTTNIVQASTNCVNWFNVSTNVAIDNGFQFVDVTAPPFSHRFYRAVVLP